MQSYKLKRFLGITNLEKHQRFVLRRQLKHFISTIWGREHLLQVKNYEDFVAKIDPSFYNDWQPFIAKQMKSSQSYICKEVSRYVPTSGSTDKLKWIPYNTEFNKELQSAAGAWICDINRSFPKVMNGKHYWSLSWIPNHLRNQGVSTDDSSLFSWSSRILHRQVMAVDERSCNLNSCEDSMFATAVYLCSHADLSLISVWSPSFLLELLNLIGQHRDRIASILREGRWQFPLPLRKNLRAASILASWNGELEPNVLKELWPQLALISAWDSSSSSELAQTIKTMFSHVAFQGKGLWATEGVVSIPIQGHHVLASYSHFYEFEDLASHEVIPSWKLEKGQILRPILTTGNGLLRYKLNDRVKCLGHFGVHPKLEFLGRIGSTDMVGEKLDQQDIGSYLKKLRERGVPALSLVGRKSVKGHNGDKPHYELLTYSMNEKKLIFEQDKLEAFLCENHHYALARDLGQLAPASIASYANPLESYYKSMKDKPRGQVKIEDLFIEN